MRFLGIKSVPISRLRLPGDFRARLEEPRIEERAKSLKRYGLINEPLVRQKDWRVICGKDRVAAHMVAGMTEVACKLVECTDEEADELEAEENIQRRHDPDEQSRLLMEQIARYEAEETSREKKNEPDESESTPHASPATPPRRRGGRPKSARTKARERVAQERGVTPEAIRKAEQRAKEPVTEAKAPPPIKTLGMSLEDKFLAEVSLAQGYLRDAANKVQAAKGALTQLQNANIPFPPARLQRLLLDLQELGAGLRGAVPWSLCPYCKGVDGVQQKCSACFGAGYITENQRGAIPENLLREENPVVMVGGVERLVSDFVDEEQAEPEDDPFGIED